MGYTKKMNYKEIKYHLKRLNQLKNRYIQAIDRLNILVESNSKKTVKNIFNSLDCPINVAISLEESNSQYLEHIIKLFDKKEN